MSFRGRMLISIIVLGVIHAAVVCAGYLAPCDPETQFRSFPYAPPARVHFVNAVGQFHLRPFVYDLVSSADPSGGYVEDRAKPRSIRFFVRDEADLSAPLHLFGVDPPGQIFLLGTDGYGRDQFSRLLYGGRVSLLSGILATAASLFLGIFLGTIAGYFGKWPDEIIMRGAELLLALPWLYCLLALRAFLPLNVSPRMTLVLVILVISLRGWARPARLIRGLVLSARERDFVLAARGFGASNPYIVARHILPQTLGVVFTQAALLIPQFILAEVTLSFLGLGFGEPAPTWGNMLASLQRYSVLTSYWWMSLPALILIPTFLGYQGLAGALHERFAGNTPATREFARMVPEGN